MSPRRQKREDPSGAEVRGWTKERLLAEVLALRSRPNLEPNAGAGGEPSLGALDWRRFETQLSTVDVPEAIAPVFLKAQAYVARYFENRVHRPDEATIEIAGERYILLRAASMSVEFVELVTSLYRDRGPEEARSVANNLLFDLAHAIGKADARSFHEKMGVVDPIERLSAGPIHFAFSGWAFVHILPESRPSPDDDYFLLFDHPFSFESHAWLAKGKRSATPVCIMNAGYSSGWCEESFGLPLVSAEIDCVAAGGSHCRFVMAPPSRIEEHLARYAHGGATAAPHTDPAPAIAVPEFFQRRRLEEDLRQANERLEQRVRERTEELVETNQRLQREIAERQLTEEQLRLLGSAVESASEGIFILAASPTDGEPRITFANQGLRRMTGRRAEGLIGQTPASLGVADEDHAVLEGLAKSLAEGRAFQGEVAAERVDGSTYALELHVMPAASAGPRTSHWIGIARDVSERKSQLASLRRQAVHDALTDLPNRVLLFDRLDQAVLKTGRSGKPLALLFLDLDGFKEINDTFGHLCGDGLLRQVAGRLRSELRATDTVARLGGDEFAILLPDLDDVATATQVAQALLDSLVPPFVIEAQPVTVGASIGIVMGPEHGTDPTTLMHRADVAMYVAKNADRGYEVYSTETDAGRPERLGLLGELRSGACRDRFLLHFQPQVEIPSGRTRRIEALVRWQHPELGLLGPREFVPLAEAGNAVQVVTEWVLSAAVRQCKRWQESGLAVGVSVNLPPRGLREASLPGEIAALLAAEGLAPRWLTLEIAEGGLLADSTQAARVLARLCDLGIGLSIDDFGTGYSPLAHLKQLPISEIKIDRSLVRDLARRDHDTTLVRAMIELGHELGREIVAEGIEDAATWQLLASLGCDLGQGHLVCPPLAERELLAWLRGPAWHPPAIA